MSKSLQEVQSLPAHERPQKRQLRVCHLAYSFYENDHRVRRYAETLAETGHNVEVLALRRKHQAKTDCIGGVRLLRIQHRAVTEKHAPDYLLKLLWFFIQSAVVLAVRHLRRPYDVVHVHNVPDFLVFAAFVPKLMGARVILDIHDILPELYAGKFGADHKSWTFRSLLWVEKLSCSFADHVIVANDLWHAKLVSRAVTAGKCTTLLNYPDIRIFKPLPANQKRRDGKFVMLYPGTLNHHQGLDIAVRAFAIAKAYMPSAELHIYGEGPARNELSRLIEHLRLSQCVRLLPRVSIEEIAHIMASADVGIIPKRADGFGNEAFSTKTLEFMASGVPIILSRTRIDELYFTDALVRFVEPGSEHDLSDAMVSMYAGRFHTSERIQAALDFALHNSSQERGGAYRNLVDSLTQLPMYQTIIL